jgi:NitT/TauT family transport system ATP-binding protein
MEQGAAAMTIERSADAANAAPVFTIDRLGKTYPTRHGGSVRALDDVSLRVGQGEFLSIVGPSGCGKSTLLKILAGLAPATAGSVRYRGEVVSKPRHDVGVVFQEATLLPWLSVMRNILVPADVARIGRAKLQPRALELLELVGLAGFHDKYPQELSGGMQQRVAICRALLRQPAVLLMDEPFGALDALTREQMNIELQRIWSTQRNTVVFITHSIPEAVLLSDRVVVMSRRPGRILDVLPIDLPRPRTLDMVNTQKFGAYAQEARRLLDQTDAPASNRQLP